MRPHLFVDRDGTLIEEPADQQVDSLAKFALMRDVVPALLCLRDAGYAFVMVSNQDGLGTPAFPRECFDGPQSLLLQVLGSQGIRFRELLVDPHLPEDPAGAATRKPAIGMVLHYLRDRGVDWSRSAVVGDRETDLAFARNLGVPGYRLGVDGDWPAIARALVAAPRVATATRCTRETEIAVRLDLDRAADPEVSTGIGFLDHMLAQLGTHAGIALALRCRGDLQVDEHHTVEDCALALGEALQAALGGRHGIARFGDSATARVPMDEALAEAVLDLSGRPLLRFDGCFRRERVGGLPTELVPHFFRSFCDAARLTLHLRVAGEDTHHMVEACFKATARALRMAIARQGAGVPSSKGVLA